jgi:hypothetical protein
MALSQYIPRMCDEQEYAELLLQRFFLLLFPTTLNFRWGLLPANPLKQTRRPLNIRCDQMIHAFVTTYLASDCGDEALMAMLYGIQFHLSARERAVVRRVEIPALPEDAQQDAPPQNAANGGEAIREERVE